MEENKQTTVRQWSGKTDGYGWMQKCLIYIYCVMDLRFLYYPMALVIPFYMLFGRKGYKAMYHYFHHRLHERPLKAFVSVYINHYTFGQVVLDRFAAYAGKKFQLDIDHYDLYQHYANDEKGFMILTAHIGNYELAGYTLISKGKRFNTLVYSGESDTINENRNRMLSKNNIRLIGIKADMSHLFIINNALRDGEIMSMAADRIFGSNKYVNCSFLGKEAKFPVGPFALAVQREVPVLIVFVMKNSVKHYQVYIHPIKLDVDERNLSTKEKIQILADKYVAQLEKTIKQYPTQWFNYFEFWEQ